MFNFLKKQNKEIKQLETNNQTTLSIVKELIVKVDSDIEIEKIKPEMELIHLGIDSIKFLNILMGLEDVLDIELENFVDKIDLSTINSVQDIVEVIDSLNQG